ncbi:uncharacterized protein J3D65DRAFT_689582 [Phyllosticta citribraziliensis]|uniref:Uncharacterized protein n=1 Tax=Phyllosticta citribraziliensis TaxID=989973 RepID=A0ABR1M317_9PEZI
MPSGHHSTSSRPHKRAKHDSEKRHVLEDLVYNSLTPVVDGELEKLRLVQEATGDFLSPLQLDFGALVGELQTIIKERQQFAKKTGDFAGAFKDVEAITTTLAQCWAEKARIRRSLMLSGWGDSSPELSLKGELNVTHEAPSHGTLLTEQKKRTTNTAILAINIKAETFKMETLDQIALSRLLDMKDVLDKLVLETGIHQHCFGELGGILNVAATSDVPDASGCDIKEAPRGSFRTYLRGLHCRHILCDQESRLR